MNLLSRSEINYRLGHSFWDALCEFTFNIFHIHSYSIEQNHILVVSEAN